MCLTVEGDSADRRGKVEPHQRRKQENPESFVPILNNLGGDAFVSTIPVPVKAESPTVGGAAAPAVPPAALGMQSGLKELVAGVRRHSDG